MVHGSNIEVMVELVGLSSKVGGLDDLLSANGFGGLLEDFAPQTPPEPEDAAKAAAEAALESGQRALAEANLKVRCTPDGEGNWRLSLASSGVVKLGAVAVRVWPLSFLPERGVDAAALAKRAEIDLGIVDAADITGLIGFELSVTDQKRCFALNLHVEGLPGDRDAAILRRVVRNREGFLRYLRLLLGGLTVSLGQDGDDGEQGSATWRSGVNGTEALLEDLVRAWSREPARLRDVQRVVERLRGEDNQNESVIPPDFDALWTVFEQAMGRAS